MARAQRQPVTAGNPLKARVLGAISGRHLTWEAAAIEMGVNRATLGVWLGRPEAKLLSRNLSAVAVWLNISVNEATTLQGGTGEEKWRQNALTASAPWHARLRKNPKLMRKVYNKSAEVTRGQPIPESRRQRIREGLRAYRSRPDAHTLGQAKKTLPGRAHSMLIQLRRHHPDMDGDALLQMATDRLQREPYSIYDEQAALMLMLTKKDLTAIERAAKAKGRKPSEERKHQVIEEVRVQWRQEHASFQGVWPAVIAALEDAGFTFRNRDGTDKEMDEKARALAVWYSRHCKENCVLLDKELLIHHLGHPPRKKEIRGEG